MFDNLQLLLTFRTYGSYYVIKEVYENGASCEYFESQLEFAIDSKINTIIIEPTKLGRETASWIALGDWIKWLSITTGLGSLVSNFAWPEKPLIYVPLGITSFILGAVYTVSWQFDPCSRYRMEADPSKLQCLPVCNLGSSSPVVLMRRRGFPSFMHSVICLTSLSYSTWQLFK